MCGIVAGVAERNIVPVLLEGLRRLEYRGYDSCGVAVLRNGAPHRVRSLTRVRSLDQEVRETGDAERASDLLEGRDRDRSQRHHRELRGAEDFAERRGL
jgi:glucosamine 6-phosphate synthetase-like amidotransferase/phosphosugar isomerase protein